MGYGSFVYKLVYLLHLMTVIVGFGSLVVASFLAARARDLEPAQGRVVYRIANQMERSLTKGPVVVAGVFGLILVILSDEVYKFSQTWISIAFLLYFGVVGVLLFLLGPNAKAMDVLTTKLSDGSVTAAKAGGPPQEMVELEERSRKAAAFTGIVHLLWALLLIDMVFKPGL